MHGLSLLPLVGALVAFSPAAQTVPPVVDGEWEVVGWSAPGVATMGPAEAASWVGKRASFNADAAGFEASRCTSPIYSQTSVESESYFLARLRIHPSSLHLNRTSLPVVEISCDDAPWPALGSLLIVADPNRLLALWEGVFFELRRPPKR